MKRLPAAVLMVMLAAIDKRGVVAATAPDFWYVLPATESDSGARELVRGIVVPSDSTPTVKTTPEGSVITWARRDGTRQAFVVRGVSSLSFQRGPLDGTTYVPFRPVSRPELAPNACCTCASFENSSESLDALSCVVGCQGCGCEGCICSPTFPCPTGPDGVMTLAPNNGSGPRMTVGRLGTRAAAEFEERGRSVARFDSRRLHASLDARGLPVIYDPDSIALAGRVTAESSVRGDKRLLAWQSAEASVILEQPSSMPVPSFHDGMIELNVHAASTLKQGRVLAIDPNMDRCSACGTHPDSVADTDIYDCVPGDSVCYRCVSWECSTP